MRVPVAAACGLALVARLAPAEEKWHEVSSESFVLMTNASPERGESILLSLENFRSALGQVLPELRRWTPSSVRVYGFRDRDSLEPFLPPSEPSGSRIAGFFRRGASENVIVLDLTGGPPAFERVLFHEYLHLVLSLSERDFPLWFEEGLSEFYSRSRLGENEAEVGVSDPRHRALLARVPLLPLEEILLVEETGDRDALFQAESWALVHYLLTKAPEGRERLARFLALHEKGTAPLAAFREAFGCEPATMEEALREYLRRARWSGIELELSRSRRGEAFSRRLSMAEVQKRWGDLFLATERLREARVCLEEAVRLDPELGPAWEALGFLELEEGEPKLAEVHLEKSMDLGAASGPGLTRYAEILLADYRGRVDSIPDPLAEKAASVLRKSLALQPGARAPSELLAFLHLIRGERLDEAEDLVGIALAMAPDDPQLLFLRGQLLAKRGEYEEARKDLKRAMERSRDPRLHQEAEDFLARMAEMERAPGR